MEGELVEKRALTDFDSTHYYRFFNAVQVNKTISSGVNRSGGGQISMNSVSTYSSSENWQLYYQAGRYFIRNYDYGGDWQLGLSASSRSVPMLMARNGSLGEQWTLVRTSDGKGFTMTNGLLGNGSYLALSGLNMVPAMQPSTTGAIWDIEINPSAGTPKAGSNMYGDLSDFEVASTSSSIPSATSATEGTETSASNTTASRPVISGYSEPYTPSSSSLGTGAIVGIAIAAAALVIVSALLAWFLLRRRNQKRTRQAGLLMPHEVADNNTKMVYAHAAEAENNSAIYEAQHKGYGVPRYEMEGAGVSNVPELITPRN